MDQTIRLVPGFSWFGKNIGIDEFLALIKYPNAIQAINTYVKYRNYYCIGDGSQVCIDTKKFEIKLTKFSSTSSCQLRFNTCISDDKASDIARECAKLIFNFD